MLCKQQEIIPGDYGIRTESSCGANYISEYCNIQENSSSDLGDGIALRSLNGAGTVFDWETSQVEQDPGVGRSGLFRNSAAYCVDSIPSEATHQITDASARLQALRHYSPAAFN